MRKLLLGTTALAAAATISANAALADVSISGSYEFKYLSRSSNDTTVDGTSFAHGDSEMIVNFSSKTDSGLALNYRYDISTVGADGAGVGQASHFAGHICFIFFPANAAFITPKSASQLF